MSQCHVDSRRPRARKSGEWSPQAAAVEGPEQDWHRGKALSGHWLFKRGMGITLTAFKVDLQELPHVGSLTLGVEQGQVSSWPAAPQTPPPAPPSPHTLVSFFVQQCPSWFLLLRQDPAGGSPRGLACHPRGHQREDPVQVPRQPRPDPPPVCLHFRCGVWPGGWRAGRCSLEEGDPQHGSSLSLALPCGRGGRGAGQARTLPPGSAGGDV